MSLRLVLVARHFWPLTGETATQVGRLAVEFQQRGFPTTLLTARWHSSWPEELDLQGVRVVRLHNPDVPYWGTWRYMAALGQFLESHHDQFDLAYVAGMRHDAYAVVDPCQQSKLPVVLSASGTGSHGDIAWQRSATFGQRIAETCQSADAVTVPFDFVQDELIEAGYPVERLFQIAPGVPIPTLRNDASERDPARRAFAEASPKLELGPHCKLVVCLGRWQDSQNLPTLLHAWQRVAQAMPDSRLWLVGEGPQEVHLHQLVKQLGLTESAKLIGSVDALDELLAAADLLVAPSAAGGQSQFLLDAMASGVPTLASDLPINRNLTPPAAHGSLIATQDASAWSSAIIDALEPSPAAAPRPQLAAARAHVAEHFALATAVESHLRLFESLT